MANVRTAVAAAALAVVSIGLAGCGRSAAAGGPSPSQTESWSLVSSSGHQVVIRYLMGGCRHDATISHQESPTRVVITVRVRVSSGICPADLIIAIVPVDLADALGRRQLIDGATGSPPSPSPPFPTPGEPRGSGRSPGN